MNFSDMIGRAFVIWWRQKALWPIGVILALCGRGDYNVSANVSQQFTTPDPDVVPETPEDILAAIFPPWLVDNFIPILIGAVIVSLAWWLLGGVIAAWANGALVQMAHAADRGERMALGAAFSQGRPFLLRVFLIDLLLSLPVIILSLAAAGLMIAGLLSFVGSLSNLDLAAEGDGGLGAAFGVFLGAFLCAIPLLLLGALAGTVLRVIATLAIRACVLENLALRASMGRAWRLITRNIGYTLLIWLGLLVTTALFGFLAALPALALLFAASGSLLSDPASLPVVAVPLLLYALVVGSGLGGILTSLNGTIWTVAYGWFAARADALQAPAYS